MPAKSHKTARLLVPYGKHAVGETIRGALADKLISDGMAQDVTPKKAKGKGAAPSNKNKGAAPENKGGEFTP